MGAGSYAELFLQYFGWGIYNLIWDVFVSFGLVYIPFGYYLFDAFTDARKKASGKHVARKVLNNLEVRIFLGVVVLTLAGVPALPLDLKEMKYNHRECTVKSGSMSASMTQKKPDAKGTGTTYDTNFTTSRMGSLSAKSPIAWAAVLSIGQAISDGIIVKIPCSVNLNEIAYELNINKIKDPALKQETADFYNACYKQALAKFDADHPLTYTKKYIDANDAEWLGSKFFLSEPGYYDTMQPTDPVQGWPFGSASNPRNKGIWNGQPPKPKWLKPYCKEWFEDKTKGLRKKLVSSVDTTWWAKTLDKLTTLNPFNTVTDSEEAMLRGLVDVSNIKTMRPCGWRIPILHAKSKR